MKRVFVMELLHADSKLYRSASDSMRAEGRAMLLSIASDLAEWPDSEVVAVIVPDACGQFPESDSRVVWKSCVDVNAFLAEANRRGEAFDIAFCIAPEVDRLLQKIVSLLRRHVARVISVCDELIELGSDKRAFHDWCVSEGIPTIPVLDVSNLESWPFEVGDHVISKSRFGAGCEGVIRHLWNLDIQRLVQQSSEAEVIWQPFLNGKFYSVGVIGTEGDPIVLPLAEQQLGWLGSNPEYLGGRMPCPPEISADEHLAELLEKLVSALGVGDGYVGLDLIHCGHDPEYQWRVVEMNPRLCTSYLGYRKLFDQNLASFWWDATAERPDVWVDKVIEFHVSMD